MDKVNLAEKLSAFSDQWAPRIVARYNDNEVCVVRVEGEFVWHKHDDTDDLFLVLEGELDIELRDRTVRLGRANYSSFRAASSTGRSRGAAK